MGIPRVSSQRLPYFNQNYGELWANFKHRLSEIEQITLDLKFGLSGNVLTDIEIAERLNFANPTYPTIIFRRAINKLRKAATKFEKERVGSHGSIFN